MAEFPKLPLWTDAYLGDTTHLTTIEHGAYLLLLIAMWRSKETRLPNDDKLLARYARLTAGQWARIRPVIMPFFKVEDGHITQSRLTDEANAVRQHSAKQSDKAKARHLKDKENRSAAAVPEACRNDASLSLSLSLPSEPKGSSGKKNPPNPPEGGVVALRIASDLDAEFDRVWSAYPRKVGHGQAKRAWIKARRKTDFETIAGPLREFIRVARGTEKDKVPHFSTWLNGERWLDDQTHARNGPRKSTDDLRELATISPAEDVARLFGGIQRKAIAQ